MTSWTQQIWFFEDKYQFQYNFIITEPTNHALYIIQLRDLLI